MIGCAFSNELVDAFPVHLVKWCDQQLHEMWVTCGEEGWCLVVGATSRDRLGKYFENIGIDFNAGYANGYTTEVNLAALDWLTQIETKLKRGYVLTIDYGYTAERYYSQARKKGTLQCYYRHSYHNDPFINIGEQDITAHVDFTALRKHGETLGLADLGFTQQGLFLMALGLGDRLSQIGQGVHQSDHTQPATAKEIQAIMQRREVLQQLISPMGRGNFGVLTQGKGLTQAEIASPLKGLTIPPMM